MKTVAFLFLFLAAFFAVQPLISSRFMESAMTCCMEMKCNRAASNKSNDQNSNDHKSNNDRSGDNKKCGNEACCMYMASPYGNFYLVEKHDFFFPGIPAEKKKKAVVNDNRLSTGLSESWHPPEQAAPIA